MGYRSHVSFCIQTKEPEAFVALLKIEGNEVINEFLDNMWLASDGILYFESDHWKWYEESERALYRVVELGEDYDKDFAVRFARVGEETDDIHEESWGDGGWDLEFPIVIRTVESGFLKDQSKKVG